MIFAIVGEIRFFVGGVAVPQTQVLFSQAGMGRREQQLSVCQKRRETWILKSARVIPNGARVHPVNAVEALFARISNGRGWRWLLEGCT